MNQNCNEVLPHTDQNGHHKKRINNESKGGWGEKGTLLHCWWECGLAQPLWRTICKFLKKLKIELSYDPVVQSLFIYLEKTIIPKDTWTPMFILTLFSQPGH